MKNRARLPEDVAELVAIQLRRIDPRLNESTIDFAWKLIHLHLLQETCDIVAQIRGVTAR